MGVTLRGTGWGGSPGNTSELLVSYITDEIRTLEPELRYARLGVRRDAPKGYDRLLFPQTNQLPVKINVNINSSVTSAGSLVGGGVGGSVIAGGNVSIQGGAAATAPGVPVSSTEGVAAIVEGTNPTAVTWGATSYGSGPFQFGILVQVSDLLVHNSAIEVVDEASRQVKEAMARLVDTVIQTVVNAGANGVIYAGGKTARTGLASGDILTQTEMIKAQRNLRATNAAGLKPFEGNYYVAVIHPNVEADLMSNSQTGAFVDVGRYTNVDDLRMGKMADFRGIRYLSSAYQNYFNSTVPVYPTTVLGDQSFGWGYFQQPTPILVTEPDSNNPLNLFTSIGGKVTLGVTRFEDTASTYRVVRVESAATS